MRSRIDNLINKLKLIGQNIIYQNEVVITKESDKYVCYIEVDGQIKSYSLDVVKGIVNNGADLYIVGSDGEKEVVLDRKLNKVYVVLHERVYKISNNLMLLKGKNSQEYRLCTIKGDLISLDTFQSIKAYKTSFGIICDTVKLSGERKLGIIVGNSLEEIHIENNKTISIRDILYIGKKYIAVKQAGNKIRIYKMKGNLVELFLVMNDGSAKLKSKNLTMEYIINDGFNNTVLAFEAAESLF